MGYLACAPSPTMAFVRVLRFELMVDNPFRHMSEGTVGRKVARPARAMSNSAETSPSKQRRSQAAVEPCCCVCSLPSAPTLLASDVLRKKLTDHSGARSGRVRPVVGEKT